MKTKLPTTKEPPPSYTLWLHEDILDDQETLAWRKTWFSPSAVRRRKEIGWEGLRRVDDPSDPFGTFLFLSHHAEMLAWCIDPEAWIEEVLDQGNSHPEYPRFIDMAKRASLAIKLAKQWADEKQVGLSVFYERLSAHLKRYEEAKANDEAEEFRLLETFRRFVQKNERLPNKEELEVELRGAASAVEDSNRTTFNRRLRSVGLDGLPDRPPKKLKKKASGKQIKGKSSKHRR